MILRSLLLASAILGSSLAYAQEGPTPTQAIVTVNSKSSQTLTAQNLKVKVNNRDAQVAAVTSIKPNGTQVALLIDDGLRTSVARQLSDIRRFITSLPEGTEIFVGYMQNGRVVPAQVFTTDHAVAATSLRIPMGSPGVSASPYFCLSDFVKNWPGSSGSEGALLTPKARFVMMLTNGVDPYNGSVSPMNQNSVYVNNAIRDAQRAGVPVYSIYYGNAGIRGGAASFSGQSYLAQVADDTGGRAYYQGLGSPVSLTPFFDQFRKAIGESYVASFSAPAKNNELVDLKFSTTLPSAKLQTPRQVRPGTRIIARQQALNPE
ncbi:vWA domain-containing protein [Edaphobacter albus]|uniref:hypothetical protein n=1 Tax=Edaphobacter sp. 4G125 TaxID=2763071 RepID=UPI0016476509|nr:hypothetical protein [Edaphobacter sp. 4G125]QNI38199.1 hypothetical protein H7846_08145 [Edaphobacter sp. 4G125]